jgi:hypothetical protein
MTANLSSPDSSAWSRRYGSGLRDHSADRERSGAGSYSRADGPGSTSRQLKGGRVHPQRDWLGGLDGAAGGQDAFDLVEGGGVAVQVAVLAGEAEGVAVRLTFSRDTRAT